MTQIVSVVSGATVLAAVLYDWAYFRVVRPNLIQLLSLRDHVTNALEWLPLSVTVGLLGFIWGLVERRAYDPAMTTTAAERRVVWINSGILYALLLLLIGLVIFLDSPGAWGSVVLIALLIVVPFLVLRMGVYLPGFSPSLE